MIRTAPAGLVLAAWLTAAPLMPVHGQASAPSPTKAQVEDAGRDLNILSAALRSDKVAGPIKNALFQCLYQNTLSKLSTATTKVLAANALDRTDPAKVLAAMAGVCGYRPAAGADKRK